MADQLQEISREKKSEKLAEARMKAKEANERKKRARTGTMQEVGVLEDGEE